MANVFSTFLKIIYAINHVTFGTQGTPGRQGSVGEPGAYGFDGMKGQDGFSGRPGLPGLFGPKGALGESGYPGRPGEAGRPGQVGPPGDDADPGPPPKSRGYFFTRHSQSSRDAECPVGTTQLWSGYSLLHLTGDGKARGQDLGIYTLQSLPFCLAQVLFFIFQSDHSLA